MIVFSISSFNHLFFFKYTHGRIFARCLSTQNTANYSTGKIIRLILVFVSFFYLSFFYFSEEPDRHSSSLSSWSNPVRSSLLPQRASVCCYVSSRRGGYLYRICPTLSLVSTYRYSDNAYGVSWVDAPQN